MTTPASGPISLANVQAEFGGTNPISLSEYYSGGAYVTAGTTGGNGSNGISAGTVIPTSAKISLANFYNASVGPTLITINGTTYTYTAGRVFELQGTPPIGTMMSITVPTAVTMKVEMWGGGGGMQPTDGGTGIQAGSAGYVYGNYQFQPGTTYGLILASGGGTGGAGTDGSNRPGMGGPGAWSGGNGGAVFSLGSYVDSGGGGGGATGLFVGTTASLAAAIGVASGGGGQGRQSPAAGGGGGPGAGLNAGTPSSGTAAQGGGTSAGGAGGTGTYPGSAGGQGGGGAGNNGASTLRPGGGGGAGIYGGGGGQSISDIASGAGAGGASYVGGFISATTGGANGASGGTTASNPGVLARPYSGMAGQKPSGTFVSATSPSNWPINTWFAAGTDTLQVITSMGSTDWTVTTTSVVTSGSTSCTFTINFTVASNRASGSTNVSLSSTLGFLGYWFTSGVTFTIDGISGTYTVSSNRVASQTISFSPGLSAGISAGATLRMTPIASTWTASPVSTNTLVSTSWIRIGGTNGIVTVLSAAPTNTLTFGAVYPVTDIPIGSTVERYLNGSAPFANPYNADTKTNNRNLNGNPGAVRFTFVSKP